MSLRNAKGTVIARLIAFIGFPGEAGRESSIFRGNLKNMVFQEGAERILQWNKKMVIEALEGTATDVEKAADVAEVHLELIGYPGISRMDRCTSSLTEDTKFPGEVLETITTNFRNLGHTPWIVSSFIGLR